MKKSRKALLSLLLCFSMLLCTLSFAACDAEEVSNENSDSREKTDKISVIVMRNDVSKGSRIASRDVEVATVESDLVPEDYLTERIDAIGMYAAEDLSAGDVLGRSMINSGSDKSTEGSANSGNNSNTTNDPAALGYVLITDYIQPDSGKDASLAIQKAINENPQSTIYFPDGEYLISRPISTSANPANAVSLRLSGFAIIRAMDGWNHEDAMIRLGASEPYNNIHLAGSNYYFAGGIVDGRGVASGISIESGRETFITETSIKNTKIGIHIKRGANSGSSDADIEDVNIVGNARPGSIGVWLQGHDNTLTNMRIAAVEVGVKLSSGTNSLRNIHPLYIFAGELQSKDPEMYDGVEHINYANSVGFLDTSGGTNWYDFCYSDQMATGFKFGSGQSVFQNCFVMWYNTNGSYEVGFECTGNFNSSILNCQVWLKSGVSTRAYFRTAAAGFGVIENPIFDSTLDSEKQYLPYLDGKVIGKT